MNSTKSWKTPTREQVGKALALLVNPQQRYYFFNRLENPQWIGELKQRGWFDDPPLAIHNVDEGTINFPGWAESRYLVRMASHKPQDVLEIALQIQTNNPSVHRDFVEAALNMPLEMAAQLVPKIKTWIELPYFSCLLLPSKVGALAHYLAEGGQTEVALDLMRLLLTVSPNSNQEPSEGNIYRSCPTAIARFDNWQYEQIVKKHVPVLVEVTGELTLKLFCSILSAAIKFSRYPGENRKNNRNTLVWEDSSRLWRPIIEDNSRTHRSDIKNILVTTVRNIAEQILEKDLVTLPFIVNELEKKHWRVFHRIALYLIGKFPHIDQDLLSNKIADHRRFSSLSIYEDYEYLALVEEQFAGLPSASQEEVFNWIRTPNIDNPHLTKQEEKSTWIRYWQRNKLMPFRAYLPGDLQQLYEQLICEFGNTEFSDIAFDGMGEVRALGVESPKTDPELEAMSIEELVSFLRAWRPDSPDPFFDGPSYEGMGSALGRLAEKNPKRYALAGEQFRSLQPLYVWNLLRGLQRALTNWQGKQGKTEEFSWPSILNLCCWLVKESQAIREQEDKANNNNQNLDWREARRAAADLLGTGLTVKKDIEIPFTLRSEIWRILKPLTQDPDPTPGCEVDHAHPNFDPNSLSINTVRGKAMHTVLQYALWVRRNLEQVEGGASLVGNGFDEMPEVRQVLEEHLDLDKELSLAIRSVYGQWFPWLVLLDWQWASQKVVEIFPHDEGLLSFYQASWNSYITLCPLYDNAFNLLTSEYRYAVEHINVTSDYKQDTSDSGEHLAQHLMTLYWRGKLSLDDSEDLLPHFFAKASVSLREKSLEFIGRSLYGTKGTIDSEILNRLKVLWESRLNTVRNSTQISLTRTELTAYGWWFVSAKFDDVWALEQLKLALEVVDCIEPDSLLLERLVELVETNLRLVLDCLKLIVEGDKKGWNIYGWSEEARSILTTALNNSDLEIRQTAIKLINYLGERGYWEFRDLLNTQSQTNL